MNKLEVRCLVRARLKSSVNLAPQSENLVQQMKSRPEWIKAKSVAAYLPMWDEPIIDSLLVDGKKDGKIISVPKFDKSGMRFVKLINALEDLEKDKFGIRTESNEEVANKFDLIIVPGRAFTKGGDRCGRGGGYYDKFLSGNSCPKIALVFQEQLFDEVPTDAYDIPVDVVLVPQFCH